MIALKIYVCVTSSIQSGFRYGTLGNHTKPVRSVLHPHLKDKEAEAWRVHLSYFSSLATQ